MSEQHRILYESLRRRLHEALQESYASTDDELIEAVKGLEQERAASAASEARIAEEAKKREQQLLDRIERLHRKISAHLPEASL